MDYTSFKIKNPKWACLISLSLTLVSLAVFIVFLYLERLNRISKAETVIGFLFLFFAICGAVMLYAYCYERIVYSKGIYTYFNPFGRTRSARVKDIRAVKFLTVYTYGKSIRARSRILFYGRNKEILINICSDESMQLNKIFLKSLKRNRIKIIREEKHQDL